MISNIERARRRNNPTVCNKCGCGMLPRSDAYDYLSDEEIEAEIELETHSESGPYKCPNYNCPYDPMPLDILYPDQDSDKPKRRRKKRRGLA